MDVFSSYPAPEKFRPVTDRALASLIGSSFDEQRNRAPSVDSQHQRAGKPHPSPLPLLPLCLFVSVQCENDESVVLLGAVVLFVCLSFTL